MSQVENYLNKNKEEIWIFYVFTPERTYVQSPSYFSAFRSGPKPRFFRNYWAQNGWGQNKPYVYSNSHALPGSNSYSGITRVYNQKSTGNAYNQKYPGNANPRQYGPINQRIKNYGPYQIQYLKG